MLTAGSCCDGTPLAVMACCSPTVVAASPGPQLPSATPKPKGLCLGDPTNGCGAAAQCSVSLDTADGGMVGQAAAERQPRGFLRAGGTSPHPPSVGLSPGASLAKGGGELRAVRL